MLRLFSSALVTTLTLVSCADPRENGGIESRGEAAGPEAIEEQVDLFRHASITSTKGQKGRLRIMAEAKTHRLSIVPAGTELRFAGLELPARVTVEASIQVIGAARSTRSALSVAVGVEHPDGTSETVRVPLKQGGGQGGTWISLEVDLSTRGPIRELSLTFDRADFSGTAAQVAVLRPTARYARPRPGPRSEARRQVVLITTDTLRADALGCYGNEVVQTPHLDSLAEDGVRFQEAYTAANVTNPSHISILTSLYPKDHKVRDNFSKLAPDVPTMLEPLRAAGFATAGFVSSFNFQPEKSDLHARFDEFYPCEVYFERRAEDVNADLLPWLGEHADQDFFAWVHYFDPHMPYAPPAPYDKLYRRDGAVGEIDLPLDYKGNLKWFNASRQLGHYQALYRGEVTYLDHHLGAVFARMSDLGIYDDAIVVVVADHGEAFGEHGVYCEHASLHDEVTRVPLIIKPSGGLRPGRSVDALVSTVDIFPTIFELLDLGLPRDLRGASLVGTFVGSPQGAPREHVFSSFARGAQESLRTTDRRFLLGVSDEDHFPRFSLRAGKTELWALDGATVDDVLEREPDQARELEGVLRSFLVDARDFEAVPIDPALAAEMEKLGYTQQD